MKNSTHTIHLKNPIWCIARMGNPSTTLESVFIGPSGAWCSRKGRMQDPGRCAVCGRSNAYRSLNFIIHTFPVVSLMLNTILSRDRHIQGTVLHVQQRSPRLISVNRHRLTDSMFRTVPPLRPNTARPVALRNKVQSIPVC
jgi:hypothetical protein